MLGKDNLVAIIFWTLKLHTMFESARYIILHNKREREDEFAEPAYLNGGQQRSKLLAATQLKSGTRKEPIVVGTEADGQGKLGGNKSAKKKYAQLSEEFIVDNRWIPLLDYLSTFGMEESDLIKIYKKYATAFNVNAYCARERLEYLLNVGVKQKDIRKILLRRPQILTSAVDSILKPRVAFLADLGIPDSKIGKVIATAPCIFSHSVEYSLIPIVRYLIEKIGIKECDLVKVVTLSPNILIERVDISFYDRYGFLSEELGASRENIVQMVRKHPKLLHYSIKDGILPRINFLRSIGMDNSAILKVLTRIPQVLSLSLERNLKPKYLYLVNELHHNVQSLTKYPTYLSLSLVQRIHPRHRYLIFLNKAPKGPFPLNSLLKTDESFCHWNAGTSVDKYFAFQKSLMLTHFDEKKG
ncbi:hypothetical protein Cgig2_012922 [Carnegiea gigantea]|uniref:Transcription termination factor MTERF9, chloroplastic n=1 Tax=Carnegiea gigantea TaxID=171969 RepID=A0A9Q1JT13_9CARY|nr:hypothetical protein Cgig2_012922 [Carnegiea gigantea]